MRYYTRDLGFRQGENGILSPSEYQDATSAQLETVNALVRRISELEARLEAKERRIVDLELRLRGVPRE